MLRSCPRALLSGVLCPLRRSCGELVHHGASNIVQGLRPWLISFLDHHVFGGVPGRSVNHAILRFLAAVKNDAQCIMVARDLAKFFDTIQLDQVTLVAEYLGAPPQLVPLIRAFYATACGSSLVGGVL